MKRVGLLLVLAIAVAGVWFWQNQDRFFPKPPPKQVAPHRWQVATATPTPAEDRGTMATNATTNATNATAASNATTNATVPVQEDTILSHHFVRDAGAYMLSAYHPSGTKRNPTSQGRLDLNLKSLNIRYGVDFPGMNVDPADVPGARQTLFRHVLSAPVLQFLAATYVPFFLDSLDEALGSGKKTLPSGEEVPLTPEEQREMRSLLAARLRGVGSVVAAMARTKEIHPLVDKYLEDKERVNDAHFTFWNLQQENATASALAQATTRIKSTIQSRELSRQRLLQAIATAAAPQGMDASELLYLAQWVHRRGTDNSDLLAPLAQAGELLVSTAAALEKRAAAPVRTDSEGNHTR